VIGPEPKAVISSEQWIAIAKSISCQKIPTKDQNEICNALMAYDLARLNNQRAFDESKGKSTRRGVDPRAKGRAALLNFIKYTRGLRHAFYCVQKYLSGEELIIEAEQLTEHIYKFQKLAKQELDKKKSWWSSRSTNTR
jgi:hypothetical protein